MADEKNDKPNTGKEAPEKDQPQAREFEVSVEEAGTERDRVNATGGRLGLKERAWGMVRAVYLIDDFCNRKDPITLSQYEFCKRLGLNLNTVIDAQNILATGPAPRITTMLFGAWLMLRHQDEARAERIRRKLEETRARKAEEKPANEGGKPC
jgi:hypothetical protein